MINLWQKIVSNSITKPACTKCDGSGYIKHTKEPLGFDYEICGCLVEEESLNYSRKLLLKSGLNERLIKHYKLEDWHDSPDDNLTFESLLNLVDSELVGNNWLFIYGAAGTGKTYAAVIAAQIAMLKEKSVYFTGVTKLLENLRPKPDKEEGGESPSLVLEQCYDVDVLILDDIGHEKSTQWVRERLYLILNERWNAGKMTIFTSNFNIEHLEETVSNAVYSRVKGDSWEIHLTGVSDRRLK